MNLFYQRESSRSDEVMEIIAVAAIPGKLPRQWLQRGSKH
jgi:hypothetical protein